MKRSKLKISKSFNQQQDVLIFGFPTYHLVINHRGDKIQNIFNNYRLNFS